MPDARTNPNDVQQMQQDAIRRVQEMQRRSRAQIHTPSAMPNAASNQTPAAEHPSHTPNEAQKNPPIAAKTVGGLLEQMGIDHEQALLLLLLLVLAQEQADTRLLLAIAYLLL